MDWRGAAIQRARLWLTEVEVSDRTYRFSPPDRTGVLLGLGGPQALAMGAALLVAVFARSSGAPAPVIALSVVLGLIAGLARVGGRPLLEAAPPALSWASTLVRGRRRWFAPLHPLYAGADASPSLPPALDGQVVLSVEPADYGQSEWSHPVAVVHDRGGHRLVFAIVLIVVSSGVVVTALIMGWTSLALAVAVAGPLVSLLAARGGATSTYAATFRASGGLFGLAGRAEQERLLDLWGAALATFCRERGPVVAVRWSQFAAPAGVEQHLAHLSDLDDKGDDEPAVASYRSLLESVGPLDTRREVLVTLMVSAARVQGGSRHGGDASAAAIEVLLEELRLFAERLDTAGLAVSSPLSPPELARALRVRLDPTVAATLDRRGRSLGQVAGLVSLPNGGPLATEADWSRWRVDSSLHRSFLVVEWPRLDAPAAWMADLVLWGGAARTITVIYEPVAPRQSLRAIRRESAKLEADAEHRTRSGFRLPAAVRRAADAVAERETELVDGYAELDYVGVVTITAPAAESLERACAQLIQVASGVGVEVRALDGRHDAAVGACLPLARALARSGLG